MMVDFRATVSAEWHRTELIRTAANANRRLIAIAVSLSEARRAHQQASLPSPPPRVRIGVANA